MDWFISMDSSYSLNPAIVKVACQELVGMSKRKVGRANHLARKIANFHGYARFGF